MQTTLFFDSKHSFGRSEDFTTYFNPPLELKQNSNYQVSLIAATLWHSWRNITSENNKFKYNNGTTWKTLTIPLGAYNITDIDEIIKRLMKVNGDFDNSDTDNPKYYISIEANYNTFKSIIQLSNGYKVDFTIPNTFRDILGFDSKIIQNNGHNDSDRVVNITDVESLQINCDLITDSYVNGSTSSVIYAFSPSQPPGYLINLHPSQKLKFTISRRGLINSVRFYITNQSGKLVDLNNERVTYFLHLSEII